MILLFLRDWRSTIVVLLNIPLALMAAVVALWLTGQSINMMTLGGLALAIGILVDESTVEIENIHTQMGRAPSIARAVRLGNAQTAIPRLLAMVCILAVFISSFFMHGAPRRCSSLCRWPSGSRWWPRICSPARSCPCSPCGSCVTYTARRRQRRSQSGFSRSADEDSAKAEELRKTPAGPAPSIASAKGTRALAGIVRLRWVSWPSISSCLLRSSRGWAHSWARRSSRPSTPANSAFASAPGRNRHRPDRADCPEGPRRRPRCRRGGQRGEEPGYLGTIGSSYPINGVFQWMRGPEEAIVWVALKGKRHPGRAVQRGTAGETDAGPAGRTLFF